MKLDHLNGFYLIEDLNMVIKEQFRFPRSKRRRIRKKWSKNPKNWRTYPNPNFYKYGNQYVCHPKMAERLREILQKEQLNVDSPIVRRYNG